jgi:hypothetical protein
MEACFEGRLIQLRAKWFACFLCGRKLRVGFLEGSGHFLKHAPEPFWLLGSSIVSLFRVVCQVE